MWNKFEYLTPNSLDEASEYLSSYGKDSMLIAGGTDLLVQMRAGTKKPKYLIGLKKIHGLNQIEQTDEGDLKIGALVTLATVEKPRNLPEQFKVLSDAASNMGSIQIRNIGTVGGNLCNASPCANLPPLFLAMGSSVVIHGPQGQRTIPIDNFIVEAEQTCLERGEILTEIRVPPPAERAGLAFIKFGLRNAMETADANICTIMDLDENGICRDARIALGAVAPTPIRAKEAEKELKGRLFDDASLERVAELASEEILPRRRKDYKRRLTKALVKRALRQAAEARRS